jgi:hypothetical protein
MYEYDYIVGANMKMCEMTLKDTKDIFVIDVYHYMTKK